MRIVNLLIIDDHPLLVEGYKSILSYNTLGFEINITSAFNCKEAQQVITDPKNSRQFEIAFVDLNLPTYSQENLNSGADLISLIKKHLFDCKIVVITSHAEAFILYNIEKKYYPDGILVKSDFTAEDLILAFETVLNGNIYYSDTVKKQLKSLASKERYLDNYNRQIISLLAQGIKSKSLPEYLPLSMSAIDKRKTLIKDYFNIVKGNDEDIIREAKNAGFI